MTSMANRMSMPGIGKCVVVLGGEKMEEGKYSEYFVAILCKYGGIKGELVRRL